MSDDKVSVCNRCGSKSCLETGEGICRMDNLPHEVTVIEAVKWARSPEAQEAQPKKKRGK